MLYAVEIENVFSVGERQFLDLRARKSVDDTLERLSPIYKGAEDRAPNVVAFFGPNAAGKSNILRSIAFGAWFATQSFGHRSDLSLPYEKFGNDQRIKKPTRLSFSFAGPVDPHSLSTDSGQCPYTYEVIFSARGKDVADKVLLEKMSYKPRGKGKPRTLFERDDNNRVKAEKGFLTSGTQKALQEVLRPRASVIATLAQLNHMVATAFVDIAFSVISNISIDRVDDDAGAMTLWYKNNPAALGELQTIARRIDLGIEEIGIDATANEPLMLFRHSGLDQIISLNRESHGTQQFIKIFPYILMALNRGGVAIIDELDTTIHPLILPEILRWFGDPKRNPYGAQIWTTCHSASLLTELTKEEVFFCKKDIEGNTTVFGLADVERVRRNENFFGKYLGGEYGAVPVLG
ncbi:MAG: ATP-binding protein [Aestuariivita sp.]|nr:ATP-binding protein [Aestuariivita sp.]MCY4346671.1 ATP-binding protein [Aestuariivita sp.]